jgi:hypothetical protein
MGQLQKRKFRRACEEYCNLTELARVKEQGAKRKEASATAALCPLLFATGVV